MVVLLMQRNDLRLLARKMFDQWQIDNYLAHMVLWLYFQQHL